MLPNLILWLLRVTDLSEAEKAARSSWSATSSMSNVDIVEESYRRGFLSWRQVDEAMETAWRRDVEQFALAEIVDLGRSEVDECLGGGWWYAKSVRRG